MTYVALPGGPNRVPVWAAQVICIHSSSGLLLYKSGWTCLEKDLSDSAFNASIKPSILNSKLVFKPWPACTIYLLGVCSHISCIRSGTVRGRGLCLAWVTLISLISAVALQLILTFSPHGINMKLT